MKNLWHENFMHENFIYMHEDFLSMHENEIFVKENKTFAQKCSRVKIPCIKLCGKFLRRENHAKGEYHISMHENSISLKM